MGFGYTLVPASIAFVSSNTACQGFPETLCRKAERNFMRTRKHDIHIYLNDKERAHLERMREYSNLNYSDIIRMLIDGSVIHEKVNWDFRMIYRNMTVIGNNINMFSHATNRDETITQEMLDAVKAEVTTLTKEVKDLRKCIEGTIENTARKDLLPKKISKKTREEN